MAQQLITQLIDDLDGSEASETVIFSLDGESYEIDLSAKNAAGLRKALDRYLAAGRPTSARRSPAATRGRGRSRSSGSRSATDPKMVRAWALEQGFNISSRGRIPADLVEQYRASGGR